MSNKFLKYEVGDVIRQYTGDRKVSWRGTVEFVEPRLIPFLNENTYWIKWDNGSSNRVKEDIIEIDKEYLREKQLDKLGI